MGEPACFNLPINTSTVVYLGLGTNLGDRATNLTSALRALAEFLEIENVSSVYASDPVGYTDQPEFWNLALRARTDLPARELLDRILAVERGMGRERTFPNAPRVIDIDILLYDDVVANSAGMEIPHPRMLERAFVLRPLVEIDAQLRHPRTHEKLADVLSHRTFERTTIAGPPIEL